MGKKRRFFKKTTKRFFVVAIFGVLLLGSMLQPSGQPIFGEENTNEEVENVEEMATPLPEGESEVTPLAEAYLDDYLIRYKGIRFGGTENVTGAPITIQSGASVSASVAFTLNTETGSTTSSGVVEKGRIAFRFKVPSDVLIASGTGIINYQEGSENDPAGSYDGGPFRYYWGILSEDLEVGSGSTAALTLTPFKNGVTNDKTTIEVTVDAFDYKEGVITPIGYIEGSSEHTLTNTIEANTNQFGWNAVSVTPATTAVNTSPSQKAVTDLKFTLTTSTQTASIAEGVGYAKQIHFESTFNLPVDANGKPYLQLDASNFYESDGVTPIDPANITFDTVANTFTIKQTIVNPDVTKEFVTPTYDFFIKGAMVDDVNTDLADLTTNTSKIFNITAVGGTHQVDAIVTMDESVVMPLVVGQNAMKNVVITYQVPKDQTGRESYLPPQKNISSINSQIINNTNQAGKPYVVMPGDKITYQLGVEHIINNQDVGDVNGGTIERISYTEIAGTHFDPNQMMIQSITFGNLQNFTAGKVTIRVTYNDSTVDVLEKDATTPLIQVLTIPAEKRAEVSKFEIIYENVNAGFKINTGPQVSYVIRDQKDIRKNGMIISNFVTSNYKNDINESNDITDDSEMVNVIYNSIVMTNGIYEHNKTGINLGGATPRTFPIENDVMMFTIKLENDGTSPMVIDEIADAYTNTFLDPYNGTTTQIGGDTAIDSRYINGANLVNLNYWESDPTLAENNPIENMGMSVTQASADMLDIQFATPIVIPVGETYYLTYTMSVNGSIHDLATIGNTFQSFYEDNGVGEGAFYWGPISVGGTPSSSKAVFNVSGPDTIIDNMKPYGDDVVVFKATIRNASGSDWGPGLKVVDTYSDNLIPHSTDEGFNTTGKYGSQLRLNTTLNLGISNRTGETTTSVVDSTLEATLTGDGTFEIDLKDTEIKDGEQLTLYYTMQVKEEVKKNEVFTNSYIVYDTSDSQITRASVSGLVNEQQDLEGLISLTKGADSTTSSTPNHPFNRLRDGDEITFTVAVSNLRIRKDDGITFQTILDTLPSNMTYVEDSLQIEYQTLTRKMVNTNENDITNNTIVSTTPLPLPVEAQNGNFDVNVDTNNVLHVTFDNPVKLSDRYYENTYENLIEYQYLITYKLKADTEGIPETTRLLNQINEVKIFFDNISTELKQINGTLVNDTTDLDSNTTSNAYVKNSGQVTILNDNFIYSGITKNAVNTIDGLATGSNIATSNVNVDVSTKRIYNITIMNYGAKPLDIDTVIDVLPEYETVVPDSMVLIRNPNTPTVSEELSFTTGTINRDGQAYQTIRVDEDLQIEANATANASYQIRYETQIDKESVKSVLTNTQTNSINGLKNQVAFYLKDTSGTMLLESGQGSVQVDDGIDGREDWDLDVDTVERYQADYAISNSANYITPVVDVKAETVSRPVGSTVETYTPYASTKAIEPGELVAWTIRIGNGNQTDTQTLKQGSKVYLVLPDGLSYMGFGLDASGVESIPPYLDASSFTSVVDAYGNTILSWTVNKDYVKNAADMFRIRTKTKAFNFTTYALRAYFVPLQEANQEFYDLQLESSNEFKSLIYDHANEFEELSKLDPIYETKTHYVYDNMAIDVYGDLGVSAMLSEHDMVGNTVVTTRDDNRLMDVADKEDTVRYTMRLESVKGTATMKDVVFVDRLPSIGDMRNLGLKERGSEADARLVDDGNFVVRFKATGTSSEVVLAPSQYQVEYFFGGMDEQFYGDDYKNVALPDKWLTKEAAITAGKTLIEATAIRVIITDPAVTIGGYGNIEVDFDVTLQDYFIGGKQAINTFGYRATVGADTELIAEVLPVAYKTEIVKDRVLVEKVLLDDSDTPEDTSFDIQLTGKNTSTGEIEYQDTSRVVVDERTEDGWRGELWFYELPLGLEYSIKEVQNPNFKEPVYTEPEKTVFSDTTTAWTFVVTNERDPLQLQVEKQWKDANGKALSLDSEFISDVEVNLYLMNADGELQGEAIDQVLLTKDNDYKASFKDVNRYDKDGKELFYTIEEVEIEGYTSSFTFIEEDSLFVLENKLIPGSVSMQKTSDKEDANLSGAVFDLYDSTGTIISTHTTDVNGTFQVDGLTPGEYYFKETKALKNHTLDETEVAFTIAFNQEETLNVTKMNHFDENSIAKPSMSTGDTTNTILWSALMILSGFTVVCKGICKRRRN